MDKDRIAGKAKEMKGAVKEGVGKMTGNTRVEAEGATEKLAGKVQGKAGQAKDAVRDAVKR